MLVRFAVQLEDKLPNTRWELIETEWGTHGRRRGGVKKKREMVVQMEGWFQRELRESVLGHRFAIPMKAANSELHTNTLWLKCA